MSWTILFLTEFKHLFIMVLPYFLLGISAGAILESKTNFNFIYKVLGQGKKSIIFASVLGAILPGCACATMPMAEGLARKGAKLGTTTAFIMTSPLLAPQTIILTYALLGPQFTIARVIFSLMGGIGIGLIVQQLENKKYLTASATVNESNCCKSTEKKPTFTHSFISIGKKLGGYFIIGIAVASALTVTIPPNLIPNTVGNHPVLSYFLASLIGIPIYICEGEEIPITYSLIGLGLGVGPSFSFLLGAVGTCIPTMLFAQKILGKKTMLTYAAFWIAFAPVSGVLFSLIYNH